MKGKKRDTKRLTLLAIITSVAMIMSFIESQIPAFSSIPGVKVGLANIAVIFALYTLGAREAIAVSFVRMIAVAFLFGNAETLIYSLGGAILSMTAMILLKKLTPFTEVAVSVAGGVCHNIGQILVACFVLDLTAIIYYLPILVLSGTLAGIAVGVASAILIKRLSPINKKK